MSCMLHWVRSGLVARARDHAVASLIILKVVFAPITFVDSSVAWFQRYFALEMKKSS